VTDSNRAFNVVRHRKDAISATDDRLRKKNFMRRVREKYFVHAANYIRHRTRLSARMKVLQTSEMLEATNAAHTARKIYLVP
jgi:hypothetical protein